jgi:hypothetical protein
MRTLILLFLLVVPFPALADDRGDVPDSIYDTILAKIAFQTTFVQFTPGGPVRWSPRAIDIATFVKAPSRTYKDTYLYAIIYKVSVTPDDVSLDVHGTTCQVVVVLKYGAWDDPTVVCEPLDLSRPDHPA